MHETPSAWGWKETHRPFATSPAHLQVWHPSQHSVSLLSESLGQSKEENWRANFNDSQFSMSPFGKSCGFVGQSFRWLAFISSLVAGQSVKNQLWTRVWGYIRVAQFSITRSACETNWSTSQPRVDSKHRCWRKDTASCSWFTSAKETWHSAV